MEVTPRIHTPHTRGQSSTKASPSTITTLPPSNLEDLQLNAPKSFSYQNSQKTLSTWERLKTLFKDESEKSTGLEHLSIPKLLELCQEKRAFAFATESNLARGWWSSMISSRFLKAEESKDLREYLRPILSRGLLVEIGVRDHAKENAVTFRSLGAQNYVGIDRQQIVERHGGVRADALEYLSRLPKHSVAAIAAFGVLNHPMNLQHEMAESKYGFWLPAKSPELSKRGHCEHEYIRRLAYEANRVLMPEGLLFGDGIFKEIADYFVQAGFIADDEPRARLGPMARHEFNINSAFFARTIELEQHRFAS